MKQTKKHFLSLDEMTRSKEYQIFESEVLLNPQYHMINHEYDIDVDKMILANEEGSFGLPHSAFIQSYRDFLSNLRIFDPKYDDIDEIEKYDITQTIYDFICVEIDNCEKWHIEHKTIHNMI